MNSPIEVNEFIHSSEASKIWAMVCTLCKNICKDLQHSHTQIRLSLANFTSYLSCTVTQFYKLIQACISNWAALDTSVLEVQHVSFSSISHYNTTIILVSINLSEIWACFRQDHLCISVTFLNSHSNISASVSVRNLILRTNWTRSIRGCVFKSLQWYWAHRFENPKDFFFPRKSLFI